MSDKDDRRRRWAPLVVVAGIVVVLLGAAAVFGLLLNNRPSLGAVPFAAPSANASAVRVTYLGVTTMVFDDGHTALLIDGFFSRPSLSQVVLDRPVSPDRDAIDAALQQYVVPRVTAVVAVHSHYDHAIDAAEVARRLGAQVVGSATTANLARGAGIPEADIVVPAEGAPVTYGNFTVRLLATNHAPVRSPTGTLDAPLVPPQPVSAYVEGGSFTVVLHHPQGTALLQASAGYIQDKLLAQPVDTVFLGLGQAHSLGRAYVNSYWTQVAGVTNATRVFPVHHDDFVTQPFGVVAPPPRVAGDMAETFAWVRARADAAGVLLQQLPFGEAVEVF